MLDGASGPAARLAGAVYRSSLHLHRDAVAGVRRQLLAVDAARWGDRELSARITAVALEDEPAEQWGVQWSTGNRVDHRLLRNLTDSTGAVFGMAIAAVGGRPHAVTGGSDRMVRLWDLAAGRQVGEPMNGHTGKVWDVATVVLDGRPHAVSWGEDATLRLWDLTTRQQVGAPMTGGRGKMASLTAGLLAGREVVIVHGDDNGDDPTVCVWDLATRRQVVSRRTVRGEVKWNLRTRKIDLTAHRDDSVTPVTLTALDGRMRRRSPSSRSDQGTALVMDVATMRHICLTGAIDQEAALVTGVTVLATGVLDGRPISVVGGTDRTVRAWDLTTRQQLGETMTGLTAPATVLATGVLHGRAIVVAGADDGAVRLWDLTTSQPIGESLVGHDGRVMTVAATMIDGRPVVVSGGKDKTVRVWDLTAEGSVGGPVTGRGDWRTQTAVLDGRPVVLTNGVDWSASVWDLATGQRVGKPVGGGTLSVSNVATAMADGRPVAVTSADSEIRVWNLATGEQIGGALRGNMGEVRKLVTAELDGSPIVVAAGAGGKVRVWDLTRGEEIGEAPTGHEGPVTALVAATLDGRPIAVTGGMDKTVRVWELATGWQLGAPMTGHSGWVRTLAVTELDGRLVAFAGDSGGKVRVWDLATRQPVGKPLISPDRSAVVEAGVAPLLGCPVAVITNIDNTVQVWELPGWHKRGPAVENRGGRGGAPNLVVATVLDGRRVAIGGDHFGGVRMWDVQTGRQIGPELRFPGVVHTLIAAPDDRIVVGYGWETAVLGRV